MSKLQVIFKKYLHNFIQQPSIHHVPRSFLSKNYGQFEDYWGNDHTNSLLSFHGKNWILKSGASSSEEKKLNQLAYLLGRGWLNIPEIYIPSIRHLKKLNDHLSKFHNCVITEDSFFVRLVQDYIPNQLPLNSFDSAIAAELAFSVWIGRRDAHACNRAFASKVPMFFDFGIAFGVEEEDFFRSGPDAGYADNWRANIIDDISTIDLRKLRSLEKELGKALIPMQVAEKFKTDTCTFSKIIKKISAKEIERKALLAGFTRIQSDKIVDYLNQRASSLEDNLDRVYHILTTN